MNEKGMKNKILIGVAIVVVIILGTVVAIMNITNNAQRTVTTDVTKPFIHVEACDILTKSIIKEVFGENIAKQKPASGDVSNNEISITTCNYSTAPTEPKPANVTLLARVARNETGADINKEQFENTRPSDAENAEGIGDEAYFNTTFHQLNVRVGGNWYILSSYSGSIENSTLKNIRKIAEKLNFE